MQPTPRGVVPVSRFFMDGYRGTHRIKVMHTVALYRPSSPLCHFDERSKEKSNSLK
ncbi:hypothetical protein JXQ31_08725 [candidate division KSB1 bacterium]|nr:hypothetical protein [candidate division KSB1 bacterium]